MKKEDMATILEPESNLYSKVLQLGLRLLFNKPPVYNERHWAFNKELGWVAEPSGVGDTKSGYKIIPIEKSAVIIRLYDLDNNIEVSLTLNTIGNLRIGIEPANVNNLFKAVTSITGWDYSNETKVLKSEVSLFYTFFLKNGQSGMGRLTYHINPNHQISCTDLSNWEHEIIDTLNKSNDAESRTCVNVIINNFVPMNNLIEVIEKHESPEIKEDKKLEPEAFCPVCGKAQFSHDIVDWEDATRPIYNCCKTDFYSDGTTADSVDEI